MAARKFTVMNLFWLREDRRTFRTTVDEQYDHLQRFENLETKIQGQLAEILEVLPSQYASEVGNGTTATWLSQTVSTLLPLWWVSIAKVSQFRNAMMTQRSNTSTRVRKQAGHAIFDCTTEELTNPQTRYEKFREKIGWVQGQDRTSKYETWRVEILHKDYNGSFDINQVFLNPVLMRVSQHSLGFAVSIVPSTRTIGLRLNHPWAPCCSFAVPRSAYDHPK